MVEEFHFPTYAEQLETLKMPAGRREAMLSGIKLFAKQGYHATSTVQIAQEAGISQATIFKYFKTKEDLLLGICEPMVELVGRPFIDKLTSLSDLEDVIHFFVRDRYAFVSANVDLVKIVSQEIFISFGLRQIILKDFQKVFLVAHQLIANLRKNNPTIAKDLSDLDIIRIFVGPLFTYIVQRHFLNIPSQDENRDLELVERQVLQSLIDLRN